MCCISSFSISGSNTCTATPTRAQAAVLPVSFYLQESPRAIAEWPSATPIDISACLRATCRAEASRRPEQGRFSARSCGSRAYKPEHRRCSKFATRMAERLATAMNIPLLFCLSPFYIFPGKRQKRERNKSGPVPASDHWKRTAESPTHRRVGAFSVLSLFTLPPSEPATLKRRKLPLSTSPVRD